MKISKKQLDTLNEILLHNNLINQILQKTFQQKGQAFLVGGAVRDLLLELPIKDFDIEIHNLRSEQLESILRLFGSVSLVGKFFGVFRLHGLDIDWSLPRADSIGRKPKVVIDPSMNFKEALRRRDVTINSMGIDLANFELMDPFNGFNDLQDKVLRATDKNLFVEDPLRFYRVMQFVGRFCMEPDNELNEICSKMDISGVSRERIEEEFKKLFLKSKKPSLAINWLRKIGRLEGILPELYACIGVTQEPKWHPEGDVYEHTMQSIDAAANLEYSSEFERLVLMWAALCHDLGKNGTTKLIDDKYTSYGHEHVSAKLAYKLLSRITYNKDLIDAVCTLVKYHMQPGQLVSQNAKISAYKRLANKLGHNVNMAMLSKLFLSDRLARNPIKGQPLNEKNLDVEKFLKKAQDLDILHHPEVPVLSGKDLLGIIEPGIQMGKILKKAYEIQIEDGIKNKDELKNKVLENFKSNMN